jgi:ribonuclease HI
MKHTNDKNNSPRKWLPSSMSSEYYIGSSSYWFRARFAGGRCAKCRSFFEKNKQIWCDPLINRKLCADCREAENPDDRRPRRGDNTKSKTASLARMQKLTPQSPTPPRLVQRGASGPKRGATHQAVDADKLKESSQGGLSSIERCVGFFDGACLNNPGPIGIGAVLLRETIQVDSISKHCGEGTNNIAEWMALVALLELAVKHNVKDLQVCGDSQLVINQVQGKYKIKTGHLRQYKTRAVELIKRIGAVQFTWIPRKENYLADGLSKACL